MLVFWSAILLFMTAKGLASAFFILFHVFFPLLRDPLIALYSKLTKSREYTLSTARADLVLQR